MSGYEKEKDIKSLNKLLREWDTNDTPVWSYKLIVEALRKKYGQVWKIVGEDKMNNLHIKPSEGLHTKPITVGELEYLYDTLHTLYRHTENNDELTLPESKQATEIYQTAANMLQKLLDFEEIEESV